MAVNATTIWDVRVGGAATNGGGFDPGNTAMATDLAATLATGSAPVVTSASYTFLAGDVGAVLFVRAGTNWLPGWYPIASVSAGAATLNAAIGAGVTYSTAALAPQALSTVAGIATTASPTGGNWSVDYSQQAAPGRSIADLVIGSTNTQLSSAASPFGPNAVGSILNIPDTLGTATSGTKTFQTVATVTITSTTLKVVIAMGNAQTIADGMRIFAQNHGDAPTLLDDGGGTGTGYAESGTWTTDSNSNYYLGTERYIASPGGQPTATATFTFSGLAPGTYTVQASWYGYSGNSTATPHKIYDNTTLLTTVNVDQHVAPAAPTVLFNVGRYSILSVSGTTATLDRAAGTASSTGGTAFLGGALDHPSTAATSYGNGSIVLIKYSATPYLHGATPNVSGGRLNVANTPNFFGWDTTRTVGNTDANRPILQANASSINIWAIGSFGQIRNLDFYRDAAGALTTVSGLATGAVNRHSRLRFRNCNNVGISQGGDYGSYVDIEFNTCNIGLSVGSHPFEIARSAAIACATGFSTSNSGGGFSHCLAINCTTTGFQHSYAAQYDHCTAYGCPTGFLSNTTGYGRALRCLAVNCTSGFAGGIHLSECSGYNNSTQDYDNPGGINVDGWITLTAAPFTNAGGLDFSPNGTAGGGAALKAQSYAMPGLSTTTYDDLGAAQSQAVAGLARTPQMTTLGG